MTRETARANATTIFLEGRHRHPETWERIRQEALWILREKIGMYCMSEKPDNILMWSHYAKDHCGYCLKFDANDETPFFGAAQQVNYQTAYPNIDFFNTPREEQVDLIFLTKYEDWRYEAEWRVIDHDTGPGLKTYPKDLLRGVIFGLRMRDDDKNRIKRWIAKRGTFVEFFRAIQDEDQYTVRIEPE
jgi:hypothetical protein